jgi:hypothetical protein
MSNHPITPPEDLIHKWEGEWHHHRGRDTYEEFMAKQAAQWGADMELDACCEWLTKEGLACFPMRAMREARRPKPPSLKEQALAALREAESSGCLYVNGRSDLIRKALEALPND